MYLVSFIDLLLWKRPLLPVFECVELRINDLLHVCLDKCLNKGKTEKRCRFDTVSILDLQAFLEKMAGSVEIAFENEFVEIQHVNASDRKCNSFFFFFWIQSYFFPLLLLQDFAGGKGRQDYILSTFEKLAFCFTVFLCLWKSVWCILIITEIRVFHCFQRRLSILKMKKAQKGNKTSHRNSFHCIKTEALPWNSVLEVSIAQLQWVVLEIDNIAFRQAPGFSGNWDRYRIAFWTCPWEILFSEWYSP